MVNTMSILQITPKDNVAVAVKELKTGDVVTSGGQFLTLISDVPVGHKVALKDIKSGEKVVKYGFPIGRAIVEIRAGEHVHAHNMKTNLEGLEEYSYEPKNYLTCPDSSIMRKFKGFMRKNGLVGIRNEIWIVPTVGCINEIGDLVIKKAKSMLDGKSFPFTIDGFNVMAHPFGCSQLGGDLEKTQKILAGIVKHPNAAGVLVLGLGCENNTLDSFVAHLGDFDRERVRFLIAQEVDDEIEVGAKIICELAENTSSDRREDVPISSLSVGLKCGGSDGFSGITANPLLGAFSDFLVCAGGSSVLTEVPEMFGAEGLLMERAENEEVFEKIVKLINGFKEYFISHGQPVYENPSPGNKAGGITTLEEKSLGCVQKGGRAPVVDVLPYGCQVTKKGLSLLEGPGNDLVSSTALGAAGCHMVLFSTGRGTPFGTFVPTVKVATNSDLYRRKGNWIDFNAGSLLEGEPMEKLLDKFIQKIIDVASGEKTKSEENEFRQIAIWKDGVTL
jgi:altronate hydrolase